MQAQETIRPLEVPGFSPEVAQYINDQEISHGPFYLFPCGLSIHRRQREDGTPHIWAGMVNYIDSGGQYRSFETAAQTSNLGYTDPRTNERRFLNPAMASTKVAAMMFHDQGKGLIQIHAFDHLMKQQIHFDEFNRLLALPLAVDAQDHPTWKLPVMPPDIAKLVEEKGIIAVRETHVRALYAKVSEMPRDAVSGLWLQALQEIMQGFPVARGYYENELQEVETQSQVAGLPLPAYDTFCNKCMKLTGRKPKTEAQTPVVNVQLPQQAAPAQTPDIERQPCPNCGEMIAPTARKCRYCSEWLTMPDTQALVSEPAPTAPLRARETRAGRLARQQAEMKAKNES